MIIFPVRHHSPAAALQVERLIRERRPLAVLVEGPEDATPLIPLLLDPETAPPVALYAYHTPVAGESAPGSRHPEPEEELRALFWPFCAYSPEYAALRAGQEHGALLQFCDVPAAMSLSWPDRAAAQPDRDEAEDRQDEPLSYGDFATALTAAAGFTSFEEFWEAAFEQEAGREPAASFIEVLADFGGKARTLTPPPNAARDTARERHMAAVARRVIAGGVPSERLLLVCGAAHVAGVAAAFGEEVHPSPAEAQAPAAIALVPYSYPRLSEQSGYGAGNRAPWFYQQVWELGGDYHAAARRTFALLAAYLRWQGHSASLAQSIDAYTLARTLAGLRAKIAPGVDEVADAATACFGQGQPAVVGAALQHVLIGEAMGRVTPKVGRTPLQTEFYATAQRLRLAVTDAPRQVLVHPAIAAEAEQSVFLRRLEVAGIPFARELESGLGSGGRAAPGGPLEQLGRVRERWEMQWTPSVDAKLIERTAWGSTLVDVCGRLLAGELAQAARIDEGTAVLLRLALCDLTEPFAAALERCESLAADSGSFPSLARAAYHLAGLLGYGAARRLPREALGALAGRLFTRAALHLPAAAICSEEAAAEVQQTLTPLYDLAQQSSPVAANADAFWAALGQTATMPESHPSLRGLALLLLELGGRLPPGELTRRLRFWLSATAEAADNARLISGVFALHRGTLVRNRVLIAAVTDFLTELDLEQLVPLLPVLRRSLGSLSTAERSYLSETLATVLGVERDRRAVRLTADAAAWVQEADAAVAALLADWEQRYGIA